LVQKPEIFRVSAGVEVVTCNTFSQYNRPYFLPKHFKISDSRRGSSGRPTGGTIIKQAFSRQWISSFHQLTFHDWGPWVNQEEKSLGRQRLSIEFPPILDKFAGRELIIQLAGWIVMFRRPRESEAARFFCRIGCCNDHLTTMTFATERGIDVQIWTGVRAVFAVDLDAGYRASHIPLRCIICFSAQGV
jgi:hypothetical protein